MVVLHNRLNLSSNPWDSTSFLIIWYTLLPQYSILHDLFTIGFNRKTGHTQTFDRYCRYEFWSHTYHSTPKGFPRVHQSQYSTKAYQDCELWCSCYKLYHGRCMEKHKDHLLDCCHQISYNLKMKWITIKRQGLCKTALCPRSNCSVGPLLPS